MSTQAMQRRVRMVATARQFYGGRSLYSGQLFTVDSEQEADDLTALNFARRVPVAAVLASPKTSENASPARPRRGRYARRDMRATDDGTD